MYQKNEIIELNSTSLTSDGDGVGRAGEMVFFVPNTAVGDTIRAKVLKVKTKAEIRPTVCGYTQRGRTPTAYDRWFAFEAGTLAVKMLAHGLGNQVIGIKDGRVYYLPIEEALATKRSFNLPLYEMINGTSDH